MTSRFLFSRRLLLLLGLGLPFGASNAWAQTPDPVSRSPFMPEGGNSAGASGATENAPLELRGRVSTKSGYMFAIYDPSKKQSIWARLNEPGSDFVIRSNDLNNDSITVDYQGRALTLAMKEAKVETMTAATNPTPAINPPRPGVVAPNQADEARRLEAVATEVRRRRMLRAQAAASGQSGQVGPR